MKSIRFVEGGSMVASGMMTVRGGTRFDDINHTDFDDLRLIAC